MMGVPRGIEFFLAFNFAVSVPLISVFRSVVKNTKHARTVELILGGVGLITVGIHVIHFFLGRNEFTQVSSLLILFAIFFMSVLQIIAPSHQLDHPSKPEET